MGKLMSQILIYVSVGEDDNLLGLINSWIELHRASAARFGCPLGGSQIFLCEFKHIFIS